MAAWPSVTACWSQTRKPIETPNVVCAQQARVQRHSRAVQEHTLAIPLHATPLCAPLHASRVCIRVCTPVRARRKGNCPAATHRQPQLVLTQLLVLLRFSTRGSQLAAKGLVLRSKRLDGCSVVPGHLCVHRPGWSGAHRRTVHKRDRVPRRRVGAVMPHTTIPTMTVPTIPQQ